MRLHELLAVVGELVDGVHVVVDDPHVLLRIVGADVDRVRPLEDLVPLRPLLDDVALRVDDDEAVLPAGVHAELAIRRLSPSSFDSLRRIPAGPAVAGSAVCVALRHGTPPMGNCTLGPTSGKPRLRPREVRQLAAREQVHAIRVLGEDALRRAGGPLLVARQRADILRPARHDFVRARDSCAPMAPGTARNAGAGRRAGADRRRGIRRPPSGMPAARPTARANAIVAVLFMPLLRACGLYKA